MRTAPKSRPPDVARRIKRIGVLTGGGDCPGLNAVIRAVTKSAIYRYGVRVFGIEDGYLGLIEDRVGELSSLHASGILTQGGTILGASNRASPTRYCVDPDADVPCFVDATDKCLATIARHELDALIVIGGDGTMSCADALVERGVNCIGVPKTIDNDIVGTDITFGFTTAYTTATLSLDRLHSTAASHHRVMVCELMGRNAGWLTLHAGLASGSDVILIPEIPFDIDAVCRFVRSRTHRGRGFSIVACAEGACPRDGAPVVARHDPTSPDPIRLGGIGEQVANQISDRTGIETRTTVLGHVQRGGPPVAADRVLATQFGFHALEMVMSGARNRMVVMQNGVIGNTDIRHAAHAQRLVPRDHPLIDIARSVRTSFGDEAS
ncbi:MAG: 6-phosphofructokinase [Phycisphaerales bacterium]|nr:6-phosphofructokinase [Phycisphaerae bacterium]NNF42942.1 6-phosphofructokinase [Phycisphaerales bacterium]NNM27744.1 6-phosphofructokinase [Phycisphaerales bacterium]